MHPGGGDGGGGEKGAYLLAVKDNQPVLKELIGWAFANYPPTNSHARREVRSGAVWDWGLEVLPMPQGVSGFAASRPAYALTSLQASVKQLYTLWRGHREVENRLHQKRDTVLGEDASRSRKGAAGLMYLRDVILSLLHLKKRPVLRSVRKFSANPSPLLKLIQGL